MVVKNLNGTPKPACECGSWLAHWHRFGKPSQSFTQRQRCAVVVCRNAIEAGALVQKEVLEGMRTLGTVGDASWYVLPLCSTCNQRRGAALTVHDDCGLAPTSVEETCGRAEAEKRPSRYA